MKLNCIIVDDEPVARKLLQEYIDDIDFLELKGSAENPLKANTLINNESIDLLFLDINMPKLNGIEYLRTFKKPPLVILTTAYAEYATEGFELDVMDYLVKPFSFERFLKACNKAKDYHELKALTITIAKEQSNYFFVKCNGKIEKVIYEDLIYIEAMLNYVILHTTQGKMIVYHTIKGLLSQIHTDVFLKVHKSYIVNLTKIKSIEENKINLGNVKVPISQNFYDAAMKVILKDRMIKR